jgi:hypothetical protein
MLKRILLALALIGAIAACNTPASTSTPAGGLTSPSPSSVLGSPSSSESPSPSAS